MVKLAKSIKVFRNTTDNISEGAGVLLGAIGTADTLKDCMDANFKKSRRKKIMRINNNVMAMNTHRQYSVNNDAMAKSAAKLSSGYRINSAGDDAAGLAISEKMRAQIRGLKMASKNSEDAISLVQTAEGALTETQSILQRMRELAVQSSSATNEDLVDRVALQQEFAQLSEEIDKISEDTSFNDMPLLDGTFGGGTAIDPDPLNSTIFAKAGVSGVSISGSAAGTYTFTDNGTDLTISDGTTTVTITGGTMEAGEQTLEVAEFGITVTLNSGFLAEGLDGAKIEVTSTSAAAEIQTGANAGQTMSLSIGAMDATTLGVSGLSVGSAANASLAISAVNTAINRVPAERANLGAYQNRLEHKINNLNTSAENLQAAESRIRDIDMAAEMTTYTQNSILVQAATSMLAQANAAPQNVLKLLQ
jgi:flagellin